MEWRRQRRRRRSEGRNLRRQSIGLWIVLMMGWVGWMDGWMNNLTQYTFAPVFIPTVSNERWWKTDQKNGLDRKWGVKWRGERVNEKRQRSWLPSSPIRMIQYQQQQRVTYTGGVLFDWAKKTSLGLLLLLLRHHPHRYCCRIMICSWAKRWWRRRRGPVSRHSFDPPRCSLVALKLCLLCNGMCNAKNMIKLRSSSFSGAFYGHKFPAICNLLNRQWHW